MLDQIEATKKIIHHMRGHLIRNKFLRMTSKLFFSDHKIEVTGTQFKLIRHNNPKLTRPFVSEDNLTGDPLRFVPDEYRISFWSNGHLYGFDLRELNQLEELVNPYNGVGFSPRIIQLIRWRMEKCKACGGNLDLELAQKTLDMKFTELIDLLETNGTVYVNGNQFRQMSIEDMIELVRKVSEHNLVIDLGIEVPEINDIECAVDYLIEIANYEDAERSTRCLFIATSILTNVRNEVFDDLFSLVTRTFNLPPNANILFSTLPFDIPDQFIIRPWPIDSLPPNSPPSLAVSTPTDSQTSSSPTPSPTSSPTAPSPTSSSPTPSPTSSPPALFPELPPDQAIIQPVGNLEDFERLPEQRERRGNTRSRSISPKRKPRKRRKRN